MDNKTKLAIIEGESRSTQGTTAPSSGIRARRARAAGVVIEKPTPSSWITLANSLPNAPPPPKKPTSVEAFDKKYGIVNNVAHLTPEIFCEVLGVAPLRQKFLDRNLAGIVIDNKFGFRARFEFLHSSPETLKDLPSLKAMNIFKKGLATSMDGVKCAYIYSRETLLGIVSVDKMPKALKSARKLSSKSDADATKRHFTSDWAPRKLSAHDCQQMLLEDQTVKNHIRDISVAGTEILRSQAQRYFLGRTVGTLFHPEDKADLIPQCRPLKIKTLFELVYYDVHQTNRQNYLSTIFGNAAGVAIEEENSSKVMAVLVRPTDTHAPRTLA